MGPGGGEAEPAAARSLVHLRGRGRGAAEPGQHVEAFNAEPGVAGWFSRGPVEVLMR